MQLLLAVAFVSTIVCVSAVCTSSNYTASTSAKFIENSNYGNNENCEYNIAPDNTTMHYLKIAMLKFGVHGRMPDCEGDYLEIFITRSQISIGKFCSSNTHGGPFTIYSADGYAKVRFSSNASEVDIGYRFSFELKPFTATLGSSTDSTCIKTYTYEHTTVIHSTGWPLGYVAAATKCEHVVANVGKEEMLIAVMDADVNNRAGNGCDIQDDYIHIKGENDKKEMKLITPELCKNNHVRVYRTRYSPVHIDFIRKRGSGSSNRGFVVGFKFYTFTPGTTSPDELRTLNGTTTVVPITSMKIKPTTAAVGRLRVYIATIIVFALIACIAQYR